MAKRAIGEPAKSAYRIEVVAANDLEPGIGKPRSHFGAAIAAVMARHAVEIVEKKFQSRNDHEEMAARLKRPGEIRDRLAIVLDVLDHVQAHNRSHLAFIGKRHKFRTCDV